MEAHFVAGKTAGKPPVVNKSVGCKTVCQLSGVRIGQARTPKFPVDIGTALLGAGAERSHALQQLFAEALDSIPAEDYRKALVSAATIKARTLDLADYSDRGRL